MNIFKSFRLKWWEAGIFKVAIVALGVAVGAYWSDLFIQYIGHLIVIALAAGLYTAYVWWKQ